jgi:hypothetical protein
MTEVSILGPLTPKYLHLYTRGVTKLYESSLVIMSCNRNDRLSHDESRHHGNQMMVVVM